MELTSVSATDGFSDFFTVNSAWQTVSALPILARARQNQLFRCYLMLHVLLKMDIAVNTLQIAFRKFSQTYTVQLCNKLYVHIHLNFSHPDILGPGTDQWRIQDLAEGGRGVKPKFA
jgi:hypothetical protein